MIDESKYDEAVNHYRSNPYWDGIYDDAPTELSRRYEGLTFYFSYFDEEMLRHGDMYRDYKKERDELEEKMGLSDWRYLFKHSANNPFKEKCREKVEQLSGTDDNDRCESAEDRVPRRASFSFVKRGDDAAQGFFREGSRMSGHVMYGETANEGAGSSDCDGQAPKKSPKDPYGRTEASRLEKA